jgi:hypothetical protein
VSAVLGKVAWPWSRAGKADPRGAAPFTSITSTLITVAISNGSTAWAPKTCPAKSAGGAPSKLGPTTRPAKPDRKHYRKRTIPTYKTMMAGDFLRKRIIMSEFVYEYFRASTYQTVSPSPRREHHGKTREKILPHKLRNALKSLDSDEIQLNPRQSSAHQRGLSQHDGNALRKPNGSSGPLELACREGEPNRPHPDAKRPNPLPDFAS